MKVTAHDVKDALYRGVFWTGIFAIVAGAYEGSLDLLAFAGIVAAFDLALTALLPNNPQKSDDKDGTISFMITPLKYPKVLDSDINDYAPEFLRLDIIKNGQGVFSGNLGRDTFKSLRDMLNTALSKQPAISTATASAAPAITTALKTAKARKK